MEFGENGAVISDAPGTASQLSKASGTLRAPGLFGRENRYIKRNKLACFVSSLLAVLFVSLAALFVMWVFSTVALMSPDPMMSSPMGLDDTPFGTGVMLAVYLSAYNFIFFMIVVPVTWFVISQTVGRLAHRGISDRWAYIRWMAFWGAMLVGLTCIIPAFWGALDTLASSALTMDYGEIFGIASGGFLMGAFIGGVAGTGVGALFVLIVRPSAQLKGQELKTADVF